MKYDDDFYIKVGDYQNNKYNYMSGFGKLNLKDLASAVISAVLVSVLGYVANLTDISVLSTHTILSIAVMTGSTSLLKALTTDSSGSFVGAIPIK